MIGFRNVSFSYKDEKACLRNLNLMIRKGETIVLAGESGCGKTTVTRLINGLIPHYYEGTFTGEIWIGGQNAADLSLYEILLKTGSVFQNPRSQFFNVDTDSELAFTCENQGYQQMRSAGASKKQCRISGLKI